MIPLALHLRLYRLAVRLYPRAFRLEYRDDLLETFQDLVCEFGPLRAWARTLPDLIVTLPRQRLETLVASQRKTASVAAAVIAVVLSLVWLATAVAELSRGPGDTLRHWWSTLPVLALIVSVAALVIVGLRRRSTPTER